ncbi:UNKNOWN [Stylonychia lemnae]|uniref:Uncharacterized protein n=1 Tax=Stylonychia lemnae TaxID=5949 RepID=A0A078AAA4_STYLE|nr:UNKNOWN [Stylonychia lemnae]|eukprot:CDW77738.1 UNKNOWN [Stylonychia lemnae]
MELEASIDGLQYLIELGLVDKKLKPISLKKQGQPTEPLEVMNDYIQRPLTIQNPNEVKIIVFHEVDQLNEYPSPFNNDYLGILNNEDLSQLLPEYQIFIQKSQLQKNQELLKPRYEALQNLIAQRPEKYLNLKSGLKQQTNQDYLQQHQQFITETTNKQWKMSQYKFKVPDKYQADTTQFYQILKFYHSFMYFFVNCIDLKFYEGILLNKFSFNDCIFYVTKRLQNIFLRPEFNSNQRSQQIYGKYFIDPIHPLQISQFIHENKLKNDQSSNEIKDQYAKDLQKFNSKRYLTIQQYYAELQGCFTSRATSPYNLKVLGLKYFIDLFPKFEGKFKEDKLDIKHIDIPSELLIMTPITTNQYLVMYEKLKTQLYKKSAKVTQSLVATSVRIFNHQVYEKLGDNILSTLLYIDLFDDNNQLESHVLDSKRKELVSNENFREKSIDKKNQLYKYLIFDFNNFNMIVPPELEKINYPKYIKNKTQIDFKSRGYYNQYQSYLNQNIYQTNQDYKSQQLQGMIVQQIEDLNFIIRLMIQIPDLKKSLDPRYWKLFKNVLSQRQDAFFYTDQDESPIEHPEELKEFDNIQEISIARYLEERLSFVNAVKKSEQKKRHKQRQEEEKKKKDANKKVINNYDIDQNDKMIMRIDPSDKKISDQIEAIIGMAEDLYGILMAHILTTKFDLFSSKDRHKDQNFNNDLEYIEWKQKRQVININQMKNRIPQEVVKKLYQEKKTQFDFIKNYILDLVRNDTKQPDLESEKLRQLLQQDQDYLKLGEEQLNFDIQSRIQNNFDSFLVQACVNQTYLEQIKDKKEQQQLIDNSWMEKLGESLINYHTMKRFCHFEKKIDPQILHDRKSEVNSFLFLELVGVYLQLDKVLFYDKGKYSTKDVAKFIGLAQDYLSINELHPYHKPVIKSISIIQRDQSGINISRISGLSSFLDDSQLVKESFNTDAYTEDRTANDSTLESLEQSKFNFDDTFMTQKSSQIKYQSSYETLTNESQKVFYQLNQSYNPKIFGRCFRKIIGAIFLSTQSIYATCAILEKILGPILDVIGHDFRDNHHRMRCYDFIKESSQLNQYNLSHTMVSETQQIIIKGFLRDVKNTMPEVLIFERIFQLNEPNKVKTFYKELVPRIEKLKTVNIQDPVALEKALGETRDAPNQKSASKPMNKSKK